MLDVLLGRKPARHLFYFRSVAVREVQIRLREGIGISISPERIEVRVRVQWSTYIRVVVG